MVQSNGDSLDGAPSTQPDITEAEMFVPYEMKQIFTHPLVSAFHGQQEWSSHDGRKLRQTIKNTSHM